MSYSVFPVSFILLGPPKLIAILKVEGLSYAWYTLHFLFQNTTPSKCLINLSGPSSCLFSIPMFFFQVSSAPFCNGETCHDFQKEEKLNKAGCVF